MFTPKLLAQSLIASVFVILLSSCSQNSLAVKESLKTSIQGYKDVRLTAEQIDAIPYASIYAKKNKGSRAFLVLAYAEQKSTLENTNQFQLKWLSANREMLVTENGRLVKTLNFSDGNLQKSYSKQADPLALGLLNASTPKAWQRFADWQPGNYNHISLESTFHIGEVQKIEINGKAIDAKEIIEDVSVPALSLSYQNKFWLDPKTQTVIASVQRPAPLLDEIEIQVLKSFSG